MTVLTPGLAFDLDRLHSALEPTGWLLTSSDPVWRQATPARLLGELPADVQEQLRDAERTLVQIDRSTWGIVSLEREHCLLVPLVQQDRDLASMKSAAEAVAQRLPTALSGSTDGASSIDLTDTIGIRSNNTGENPRPGPHRLASHAAIREYLTEERRREARWLRYAVILTVLFVASLTLLVNLQFEFSDRRSPAAGVHWVFG